MDQKTFEKLALSVEDNHGISHDLDECMRLLTEHRKNRYMGLGYESKNDGQGSLTVTIHFPSPSEAAKYEAMTEAEANGMAPQEEEMAEKPMMASRDKVMVRIADELKPKVEPDPKALAAKYPRKYLESMGIIEDQS